MSRALALVAGGMSQRKAAIECGVSLAGVVKALKRERVAQASGAREAQ
jgi:transposase